MRLINEQFGQGFFFKYAEQSILKFHLSNRGTLHILTHKNDLVKFRTKIYESPQNCANFTKPFRCEYRMPFKYIVTEQQRQRTTEVIEMQKVTTTENVLKQIVKAIEIGVTLIMCVSGILTHTHTQTLYLQIHKHRTMP